MAKIYPPIYDKVKAISDSPGVYMFLDEKGGILYVGKASRLRRRVASYFQKGRAHDSRLELLVSETRDIRTIPASSEAEALIYEAGLIKSHRPRFNIELKDDKSYPFLKVTTTEEYPRVYITRKKVNDGSLYYGPYVDVKLLKEAVSFMKKVFPLRTCKKLGKKLCLEYHIKQCPGPCEGRVSPDEYNRTVGQLTAFLEGRKDDLIGSLRDDMKSFSNGKEYEKAMAAKRRIEALTAVQKLHDWSGHPIWGELDELKEALGLPGVPGTIECFDISNTGGKEAVGSMVSFREGRPSKDDYRRFRIREVKRIDDYSMMREVVRRRYSRLLEEGKELPDLVLIDGGKGHLDVAKEELVGLGIGRVRVASIAKEFNHLYTETRREPIRLSPGSRLMLLIQRIRDEAHRFAISYHRKLRDKKTFESGLRDIKGVGPVKEKKILEKFGRLESVKKALVEELEQAGIGRGTAEAVYKWFHE